MFSPKPFTRRAALRSLAGSSLVMPGILSELLARDAGADPLAPRAPHFEPRAKRVIFLYMTGGVSHIDTFDPKPALTRNAWQELDTPRGKKFLKPPQWEFKPRGASGIEVSEIFPHMAELADDICLIRSMRNDHNDHFQATLGIHTGSVTFARPSFGSWVSYGLGTENRNLPSFVVLAPFLPYAGAQGWSADFLPGAHEGTRVMPGPTPIPNMTRRAPSAELQEMELGLLEFFNKRHLAERADDGALAARIKSYETAFGMQMEAPDVFDFSKESDATHAMYGLERGSTEGFAWQCLAARRLAERGVRFIELIDTGATKNWDAHGDMNSYEKLAANVDRPIAGLVKDLKARGMLDDTLVVWTTEFGRMPWANQEGEKGRGHHAAVFSTWLAGAGVKPGFVFGESDELGMEVARDEMHLHDYHATLLHLLGLDHTKLTYRHAGRDFRLTDVHGRVIEGVLA